MSKTFEFFKELPEYLLFCKELRGNKKTNRVLKSHQTYNKFNIDDLLYWHETTIGYDKCRDTHLILRHKHPCYGFTKEEVLEMIGNVPKYIKVPKG